MVNFHINWCKMCKIDCLKRRKINEKRPRMARLKNMDFLKSAIVDDILLCSFNFRHRELSATGDIIKQLL